MKIRISTLLLLLIIADSSIAEAVTAKPSDSIYGLALNHARQNRSYFNSVNPISSRFIIKTETADIGKIRSVYLIARKNDEWFMRNIAGEWSSWDQSIDSLAPAYLKMLMPEDTVEVSENEALPTGKYTFSRVIKIQREI